MSSLQARILVAAIYFPLLLLSVFDEKIFTLAVTLLLAVSWYEFLSLRGAARDLKEMLENFFVILLGSFPPLLYFLGYSIPVAMAALALALQTYVILGMIRRRSFSAMTEKLGFHLLGFIYLTGLFSLFWAIRTSPGGKEAIWFLLFVVGASDTVAYFFGRLWGRTPFFPHLSPKKTFEGFWGGLLGAVILGVAFHFIFQYLDYITPSLSRCISLAVLISVVGAFGDLFESMLKRHFGVKDSGKLMGAHGGVMDRFDAVLFASVPLFFYIVLRGGFI